MIRPAPLAAALLAGALCWITGSDGRDTAPSFYPHPSGAAASTIRLRPPTIPAPSSIAGCTHWDSSQGVTLSGSTVTGWADTRGTVTLGRTGAPTYAGGRVVTDGVDDSVRLLTWAHGAGTGPVSMWLVASIVSSAHEDVPIAIGDESQIVGTYRALYRPPDGTTALWTQFGGGWNSGISWDLGGASHVWYVYQPGTGNAYAVTLGRDGAYASGTASGAVISAASGIIIGGWRKLPSGQPYWAALSVRHAVVCIGALTTGQRDSIHAWLAEHP